MWNEVAGIAVVRLNGVERRERIAGNVCRSLSERGFFRFSDKPVNPFFHEISGVSCSSDPPTAPGGDI